VHLPPILTPPSYKFPCGIRSGIGVPLSPFPQAQRFRGMDVDGVEIGACRDKNLLKLGIFQKRLQSLVSSIDKTRVAKGELTKL